MDLNQRSKNQKGNIFTLDEIQGGFASLNNFSYFVRSSYSFRCLVHILYGANIAMDNIHMLHILRKSKSNG
jgi:hypothetical protein